ncbi:MAG: RecX family transcriptional regulator [Bacilli bacterium]|nr:RecX family transcriptional regulator [Bacilli bacterium]
MKILKYTKYKSNQYKLLLENNEEIVLYDEIILKYELLITKKIKNINVIIEDNKYLESYYLLLKKLNRKQLSVKEARNYLKLNGYTDYSVIDRLVKEKYLDDEKYLSSYINTQVKLKVVGPDKIINDLIKLGFSEEDIKNKIYNIDNDIWFNKINKYLDNKIKINKKYSNNTLKQKLLLDLINKGFYKEDIVECLNKKKLNDDYEILIKDYERISKVLKRKYTGIEYKNKLKQKLITKGYSLNDINKVINE